MSKSYCFGGASVDPLGRLEASVQTLFKGLSDRSVITQRFRFFHQQLTALQTRHSETEHVGDNEHQRHAALVSQLNSLYEAALAGSSCVAAWRPQATREDTGGGKSSSGGGAAGATPRATAWPVAVVPSIVGGPPLIPRALLQGSNAAATPSTCFAELFSAKGSACSAELDRVTELFCAHVMSEKRNGVFLTQHNTATLSDAAMAVRETLKDVLWLPERRCAVLVRSASPDIMLVDDGGGGDDFPLIVTLISPSTVRQQRPLSPTTLPGEDAATPHWNLQELLAFGDDGVCAPLIETYHIPIEDHSHMSGAARFEGLLRSKIAEHHRDWSKQHRLVYTPSIVVASILAVCADLTSVAASSPKKAAVAPTVAPLKAGATGPFDATGATGQSAVFTDCHWPALGYRTHSMCVAWPVFCSVVHHVLRLRRLATRLLATFLIKDLYHNLKNVSHRAKGVVAAMRQPAAATSLFCGGGGIDTSCSKWPLPQQEMDPRDEIFLIRQGLRDRQSALELLSGWVGSCLVTDGADAAATTASPCDTIVAEISSVAVMSSIRDARRLLYEIEDVTSAALQPSHFNTQMARLCHQSRGARAYPSFSSASPPASQGQPIITSLLSTQRMKIPSMVARPIGLSSQQGYDAWCGSVREPQAVLFELERLVFDLLRDILNAEGSDSDKANTNAAALNVPMQELCQRWDEYDKYADIVVQQALGAAATSQGPWVGLCQLESRRRLVGIVFALYAEVKMQNALSKGSSVGTFTMLPVESILNFLKEWVVDAQCSTHQVAWALRRRLEDRFLSRRVVWSNIVAFGEALSLDPVMEDVVCRQQSIEAYIGQMADATMCAAQATRAEWSQLTAEQRQMKVDGCETCETEAEAAREEAVAAAAEKNETRAWAHRYNSNKRAAAPAIVTWEDCYTFKECTACTRRRQQIEHLQHLKSPVLHLPIASSAIAALFWPPQCVQEAMSASVRVTKLFAGSRQGRGTECPNKAHCRFLSDAWLRDVRHCPSYVPSPFSGRLASKPCMLHFHEAPSKPEVQTISIKHKDDILRVARNSSAPCCSSADDKAMPSSELDVSMLKVHRDAAAITPGGAVGVPAWLNEHPEARHLASAGTTTRGNISYTCSATSTRTLLSVGREAMSIVASIRGFGATQHRLALQALLSGVIDGRKLESSAELRQTLMLAGAHVRGLGGQDHLSCLRQLQDATESWIDQVTLPNALALVCAAQQYGTLAWTGRPRDAAIALSVVSRAVAQAAQLSKDLADNTVGCARKPSRDMWALVERVSAIAVSCCAFLPHPQRRATYTGAATTAAVVVPSMCTAEAYCVTLLRMRRAFVLCGKHHPTTVHLEQFLDAARCGAIDWLPAAIAAAHDATAWQVTLFRRVVASIDPTTTATSQTASHEADALWARDKAALHVYAGAMTRSCGTRTTTYQINAWSGEVFVNGASLLGLPDTLRHRETFRELFGDLNFEVCVAEDEYSTTTTTTKTTGALDQATTGGFGQRPWGASGQGFGQQQGGSFGQGTTGGFGQRQSGPQQQQQQQEHCGYRTVSNFANSVYPQLLQCAMNDDRAMSSPLCRRDITFAFLWNGHVVMEERSSDDTDAITARQVRHCDDVCVSICGKPYIPWRTTLLDNKGNKLDARHSYVLYRPKPPLPGTPWLGSADAGKVSYVGVLESKASVEEKTQVPRTETVEIIREIPEAHQLDLVAELVRSDMLPWYSIVALTEPSIEKLFAYFEPIPAFVSQMLEPIQPPPTKGGVDQQPGSLVLPTVHSAAIAIAAPLPLPQPASPAPPSPPTMVMRAKITLERFTISFIAEDDGECRSFVWQDDPDYEVSPSQFVAWLPCSQNHLRLTLRRPRIATNVSGTAAASLPYVPDHRLKPSELILLPVGSLAQGRGTVTLPGPEKGLHRVQYIKVHRHEHFGYIECDTISGRLHLAALLCACDSGIIRRGGGDGDIAAAAGPPAVVEHIVTLLRRCIGNRPWSEQDRRSMLQIRHHRDASVFLLGAAMEAAAAQVSFLPHDDARLSQQHPDGGDERIPIFANGEALNKAMSAYRVAMEAGRIHPSCVLDEAELRLALRIPVPTVRAAAAPAKDRHSNPTNPTNSLLQELSNRQTRTLHALLGRDDKNESAVLPGSDFVLRLNDLLLTHDFADATLHATQARREQVAEVLLKALQPLGNATSTTTTKTTVSAVTPVDPLPIKSSEVVAGNAHIAPGLAEAFFSSIEASWNKGHQLLQQNAVHADPLAVESTYTCILTALADCESAKTKLRDKITNVNKYLYVATRSGAPHPVIGLMEWLQHSGSMIGVFTLHDVGKFLVATAPQLDGTGAAVRDDNPQPNNALATLPLVRYLHPAALQRLRRLCNAYVVSCAEWDSLLRLKGVVASLLPHTGSSRVMAPVDVSSARVSILNEITSPRAAIEAVPSWLVMEVEQRIRIRKAQYDTWRMLATAADASAVRRTPLAEDQPCGLVTQLNMGEGKTRVIIPMLMLSELEQGRSVCVHALSSVVGEYTEFYENCMSSPGLCVRLLHFPFNRDVPINVRNCRQMVQSLRNFRRMAVLVVREHFASFVEKHEELWLADQPTRHASTAPPPSTFAATVAANEGVVSSRLCQAFRTPATSSTVPSTSTRAASRSQARLPSVTELFGSCNETLHVFDEVDELLRYDFGLVYAHGAQQKLPSVTMRGELLTAVLAVVADVTCEWKRSGNIGGLFSWGTDAASQSLSAGEFPSMHLVLTSESSDNEKKGDPATAHTASAPSGSDAFLKEVIERFLSTPPRCASWMRALPKEVLLRMIMDPADADLSTLPDIVHLDDHAEQLMLLRGLALHRILLFALSRRPQENYGVPPIWRDTRLAVPYEAADVPTARSEFAQADVSLLLTLLAYYHRGLSIDQFGGALRYLAAMPPAARRMAVSAWLPLVDASFPSDGDVDLNNDVAVQHFYQLLYKKMPVVSFWVRYCVFEVECKQFPAMLVASAWDVARVPRSVGFSGTSDARWLLPESVRLEDHPDQEISAATGVMMRLMMDHTLGDVEAMEDPFGVGRPMAILQRALGLGCRAVIDVGAAFAGKRMDALARAILPLLPIEMHGVCYFDIGGGAQGHWVILEKKTQAVTALRQSAHTAAQCFVLFDQARCRGSDHKLRSDTVALVTLGVDTTKDALMQAVGRLRQFGRAQKIRLIAPPEVMPHLTNTTRSSGSSNQREARSKGPVDVLRWLITNTLVRLSNGLPLFVFAAAHQAKKVTKLREANVGAIPVPHEAMPSKMYASGTSMQPLQTLVDRVGCTFEVRQRMQDLGGGTHKYRSSASGTTAQQTTEREVTRETQREEEHQVHYLVRQPATEGVNPLLLDVLDRRRCAQDFTQGCCLRLDVVMAAYLGQYVRLPNGMHVTLNFGTVFNNNVAVPPIPTAAAAAHECQLNSAPKPSPWLLPLPAIVRRIDTVIVFCETRQAVLLSPREAADMMEACAACYGVTAVRPVHLPPAFGSLALVLVHDVPLDYYQALDETAEVDTASIASIELSEDGTSSDAGSDTDADVTQKALALWVACVQDALSDADTTSIKTPTNATTETFTRWMRSVVCFAMLFNGYSAFPRGLHNTLRGMLYLPTNGETTTSGGGLSVRVRTDGLKTAASSFLRARELLAEYMPSSDLEAVIKESIAQHVVLAEQQKQLQGEGNTPLPPPAGAAAVALLPSQNASGASSSLAAIFRNPFVPSSVFEGCLIPSFASPFKSFGI